MGLTFVYRKRADDGLTTCVRPDSRYRRPPNVNQSRSVWQSADGPADRARHTQM